jgi:hypothetical protein
MQRHPKPSPHRRRFVIDYTKEGEDKIIDIALLEKFQQERIKVAGGKDGTLLKEVFRLTCSTSLRMYNK